MIFDMLLSFFVFVFQKHGCLDLDLLLVKFMIIDMLLSFLSLFFEIMIF